MKLVIAEKPSVAQSIAAVIGAQERKEGYLQGNGFLVSWCVGHLVELAPADSYDEKYRKWRYEDLPVLPSTWQYDVPKDKQKQFKILRCLMNQGDVESLICATDAGREGELIFRLVYQKTCCRKPVQRLWVSSMEDTAIRNGFALLRDSSEYDRLYKSALCRAQADWIIGINATRLFSVIYKQTLNIGRVMTPTLAMIVNREAAIKAFKPEQYYTVVLDCGGFTVQSEKQKEFFIAERMQKNCHGKTAIAYHIDQQEKRENPPKLYDLTTLQRDANRLLGFTAQQTLDYAQNLYEKKLITYPRTDSRYLTTEMADVLPSLIWIAAKSLSFYEEITLARNVHSVIDDKKVSDHHAIIPTAMLANVDTVVLPAGEHDLLTMLAARLISAVGEPHVFSETTINVQCAGHNFTVKGKSIRQAGWKDVEELFLSALKSNSNINKDSQELPLVEKGQRLENVVASIKKGQSTPPKHFTEDTMLSAMETAGSEDTPEDVEHKGLGTPATRAGILEKLIKTGLVERQGRKKQKVLLPTHKGEALISVLPDTIISPQMTAEWESKLKQVEKGQLESGDFLGEISKLAAWLVQNCRTAKGNLNLPPTNQNSIGFCPRCKNQVFEDNKGFVCWNQECQFTLWKGNSFFEDKKKTLTTSIAAALIKDGRVKLKDLYSSKTGKTYDAVVVLEDIGGKYARYRLDFGKEGMKS